MDATDKSTSDDGLTPHQPHELTTEQAEYARRESAAFMTNYWYFVYTNAAGKLCHMRFWRFKNALRMFRNAPGYMRAVCIARNGVIAVTRKASDAAQTGGAS